MATSYKPSCLIGLAFFFDLLLDLFDSLWSSNAYSSPKAVDLVECRASHFNCHAQFEVSITIAAAAMAYRESIVKALPRNSGFDPLMILHLIDNTSLEEIKLAREFMGHGLRHRLVSPFAFSICFQKTKKKNELN